MAKKRNLKLMEQITQYVAEGLTDSAIAKLTGYSSSLINHYRHKLMGLEPNWLKQVYHTPEDKIKGYMLRNLRYSAKRRGLSFNLTIKDLTLPTHCPLLGMPLLYNSFSPVAEQFNANAWATVDRIDNSLGYVQNNVWVISRLANTMKNEASLDQLYLFATTILKTIENHRALGNITDSGSLDS